MRTRQKKSFGLQRLGDGQGGADLFVEPLDEMRGKGGGFLFVV